MKKIGLLLGAWIWPLTTFAGMGEILEQTAKTVGPFHLVLLHLPIGLLVGVFLLDFLALFPSRREHAQASLSLLWVGAPAAVLAAVSGWLLAQAENNPSKLLECHMWMGWGVALLWILMLITRKWAQNNPSFWRYLLYTLFLLGNGAATTLAGHAGGSLVHGKGFLTDNLPIKIKKALKLDESSLPSAEKKANRTSLPIEKPPSPEAQPAGAPVPVQEEKNQSNETTKELPTIFTSIVSPILEAHCIECHGSQKKKGGLRLDSREWIEKGGKNGPAVVPGDLAESHIHDRISLPDDHEDVMPPEKKPRLKAEEIAILDWWIAQGASFTAPMDEAAQNAAAAVVASAAQGKASSSQDAEEDTKKVPTQEAEPLENSTPSEPSSEKAETLKEEIVSKAKDMGEAVLEKVDSVKEKASAKIENIKEEALPKAEAVVEKVSATVETAREVVAAKVEDAKEVVANTVDTIKEKVAGEKGGIENTPGAAKENVDAKEATVGNDDPEDEPAPRVEDMPKLKP